MEKPSLKDKPIQSWVQLANIVVGVVFIIINFSVQIKPFLLLTSIGAMSAVFILVFKDSILGFVEYSIGNK